MFTQEQYADATKTVEQACRALGHDGVSIEALEELQARVDDWGWGSVTSEIEGPKLRFAHTVFMHGMRALFAPAEPNQQGA